MIRLNKSKLLRIVNHLFENIKYLINNNDVDAGAEAVSIACDD